MNERTNLTSTTTTGKAVFGSDTTTETVEDQPLSIDTGIWNAAEQMKQFRQVELENAILLHIQAMRAIGRDVVNTAEIARALDIPRAEVESAIPALIQKGVKIA